MDPSLHQQQGINHLKKVLEYAPFVEQDGEATVHLTPEDWHVLADTLFALHTPAEMLPEEVQSYRLTDDHRRIELTTGDMRIMVEIM